MSDSANWNYLQVEVTGSRTLHPMMGPGGLSRAAAHAKVHVLLERFVEVAPYAERIIEMWNSNPRDDTVYVEQYTWAIYEAEDARAGARVWVEDLALRLRDSGSRVRIAW